MRRRGPGSHGHADQYAGADRDTDTAAGSDRYPDATVHRNAHGHGCGAARAYRHATASSYRHGYRAVGAYRYSDAAPHRHGYDSAGTRRHLNAGPHGHPHSYGNAAAYSNVPASSRDGLAIDSELCAPGPHRFGRHHRHVD